MLIIAQPKSASTSLLEGLRKATHRPCRQVYAPLRKYETPEQFDALPHSDIKKTPKKIASFCESNAIYKQHFPPVQGNLDQIFENRRKVVLTVRDPLDSFFAYERAPNSPHRLTEAKYMAMQRWHDGWSQPALRVDHIYVVHFTTLIDQGDRVIDSIMDFWGIKNNRNDITELPKRRASTNVK